MRPSVPASPPTAISGWREFGRSWPREPPDWVTWVAPLGGPVGQQGDALYRTLVLDGAVMSVAIDLGPRQGAGPQALCRDRCRLPGEAAEIGEIIHRLLASADERASRLLSSMAGQGTSKGANQGEIMGADQPAPWPGESTPDTEHRLRERAYFLWEREGRPDGRALEFWVRARHEEETLAA